MNNVQRLTSVIAIAVPFALAGCTGARAPEPMPAPAPAVPEGAVLEDQSTTTEADGTVVNRSLYRLPNELLTNGPHCSPGDPPPCP